MCCHKLFRHKLFHMVQDVCMQVGTYSTGCLMANKMLLKKDQDTWLAKSFMSRFPTNSTCSNWGKKEVHVKYCCCPIMVSSLLFINRLSRHFSSAVYSKVTVFDVYKADVTCLYSLSVWRHTSWIKGLLWLLIAYNVNLLAWFCLSFSNWSTECIVRSTWLNEHPSCHLSMGCKSVVGYIQWYWCRSLPQGM